MKKNTGSQSIGAQMTTAADGSAFTGTVTVYITGDNGTQAIGTVGSGICTHEGGGWHSYAPSQAETNYNHISFQFRGTGAITVGVQLFTTSLDVHDTVRAGLTALPNATAGAAGGIFIAGTNAACTITGNFAIQGGITVTQSSSNTAAIIATGNGTGQGLRVVGGSGAAGMDIAGTGAASGLTIAAGTGAGIGLSVVGGGTSGAGISVSTTSGDGVSITPTAGHGIVATGQGASKHGMQLTGGGSGTCDGLKAVAGTGGVAIRGPLDVVTLVNTLTTYTGDTPQTGDSFALIGAAGAGLTALATQASVNTIDDLLDTEMPALTTAVGAIKTKTDFLPSATAGSAGGVFIAGTNAATTVTTSFTTTFTGNLTGSVGSIATGGITSASFDTGAITATAIATDAIGSNELAASAVAEIADAVWDEAMSGHVAVGTFGEGASDWASQTDLADVATDVNTIGGETTAILADTNELQADWANGGRLDLLVDAILADTGTDGVVVNAAGLATDAVTEIVTAIFANAPSESYATDGSAPTLAQFLYMLWSCTSQFSVSSTTITSKRLDGTTSAMTFTMDDATNPTSRFRAS